MFVSALQWHITVVSFSLFRDIKKQSDLQESKLLKLKIEKLTQAFEVDPPKELDLSSKHVQVEQELEQYVDKIRLFIRNVVKKMCTKQSSTKPFVSLRMYPSTVIDVERVGDTVCRTQDIKSKGISQPTIDVEEGKHHCNISGDEQHVSIHLSSSLTDTKLHQVSDESKPTKQSLPSAFEPSNSK